MNYQISIIKDKEIIEQHIINIKNSKDINKVIGEKTHRIFNDGSWTEQKYKTIVKEWH